MDLDEVKLYLRVDGTDDDTLITSILSAAEKYLENSGVNKDYTNDLYKLSIQLLVSHWYENRAVDISSLRLNRVSFSLDTMIIQLKYTQSVVVTP